MTRLLYPNYLTASKCDFMVLISLIPKGLADYILIFDKMTAMLANLFNFQIQEVIFDENDALYLEINQNVTTDFD